jgi:hypothetical protein
MDEDFRWTDAELEALDWARAELWVDWMWGLAAAGLLVRRPWATDPADEFPVVAGYEVVVQFLAAPPCPN